MDDGEYLASLHLLHQFLTAFLVRVPPSSPPHLPYNDPNQTSTTIDHTYSNPSIYAFYICEKSESNSHFAKVKNRCDV